MVTQDPVTVSKMKKKMKKNKKKLKKKQKKGLEGPSTESEGESVDLSEKLYPLSHYVSDQDELVNQMFTIIHGSKLEAMLPPVLKSVPLKELKKFCLHELRGMSKKRILACINGQVMEGSSGSEDEDEEEVEEQAEKGNKPDEVAVVGKRKQVAEEETPESYLLKKIKVEPGTEDNSHGAGKTSDTGKSVLELLELEMRARIIKTMLEKGQDGCKIAEDAIAAVMQSAKQITGEDPMQPKDSVNRDETGGRKEEQYDDREVESNNEKERSRSSRKSHRKRHATKDNERRRREHDRSEENHSKQERKLRGRKSKSNTHTVQRKKITRKEFQERMKRAKENRTYRQRKASDDDEKENDGKNELQKNDTDNQGERNYENMKKIASDGETVLEGKLQEEREEGDVDGSEKEEGEIDSNEEEEEGACSPSDISSRSSYYSYSRSCSSSRSRSRSYTRSPSPYRKKRSRSRRRRSYSHSRSRSPVYRGRNRQVNYPSSSMDKRTKNEQHQSYSKNDERDERSGRLKESNIVKEAPKPSQPAEPKEEEENWGQKCDIEFVDSDEDFDDNPDESKKPQPGAVSQASERASISFSFQKKPTPSITPGVDLDDLPLKKSLGKDCSGGPDVGVIAVEPPKKTSEEIVISSDSEGEVSKLGSSVLPSVSKQKDHSSKSQSIHASISAKTSQQSGTISDADGKNSQAVSPQICGTNISSATVAPQSKKEIRYDNMQSKTAEKVVRGSEGIEPQTQSSPKSDSSRDVTSKFTTCDNRPTVFEGSKSNSMKESRLPEQNVQSKTSDSADTIIDSESFDAVDSVQGNGDQESEAISQETMEVDGPECASSIQVNLDDCRNEKLEPEVPETEESQSKEVDIKISLIRGNQREEVEIEIPGIEESQSENLETKIPETGHEHSQESVRKRYGDIQDCDTSDSEDVDVRGEVKSAAKHVSDLNIEATKLKSISANEGESHTNGEMLSTKSPSSIQAGTCPEITVTNDTNDENKAEVKNIQQPNDTSNVSKTMVENIHQPTEDACTQKHRKDGCTEFDDEKTGQLTETKEDFYRGVDQLEFSDEDDTSHDPDEFIRDDTPVEPIRIETGLISKPVVRREKIDFVAPEVSWTRKEKKKREKSKRQLAVEGIGLIKSTLAETSTPPAPREIDEPESTVSDVDNSQLGDIPTGPSTPQTQEESLLVDINYESCEPKSDECLKMGEQETEIIGVIETSSDAGQNHTDEMDLGGASWSMRWLQSEKVQKVVSSSKMLSRVRKKIQRKGKEAKTVVEKIEVTRQQPQPQVSVIGSIEEYERLFGMKVKTGTEDATGTTKSCTQEGVATTSELKSKTEGKAAPIFGSEDEGEDSEEEALWSKILKK